MQQLCFFNKGSNRYKSGYKKTFSTYKILDFYYSKTLRYPAFRYFRYPVLNWVQKHLRYSDFDQKPWKCAVFAQIFWVLTNLMMHGFWDTRFFQEPKTWGLAVIICLSSYGMTSLNLHLEEDFSTCKVWTDFRLKTCSQLHKAKIIVFE